MAEEMHHHSLARKERVLEKGYSGMHGSVNNIASVLTSRGKYEAAGP